MSTISVELPGIDGGYSVTLGQTTHEAQIHCIALRHAVDLPLTVAGTSRTEGESSHGPIGLVHYIDKATPALRAAASAGTLIANANIRRITLGGGARTLAEHIVLGSVYVVRVDVDTRVDPENFMPEDDIYETFWLEYQSITSTYYYKAPGAATTSAVVGTHTQGTTAST